MTSWSYDLSRMRIFCPAMSDSLSLVPSASFDARCETLLLSHHCFDVNRRMFTRRHTRHPRSSRNPCRARPSPDARVAAQIVRWLVKLCSATRGLGDVREHQTYALPGSDSVRANYARWKC